MTTTHYQLLDVPRTASHDEIKHAFRREIARYHPDKVQHLGREFETIAAVKAAELTQAYTTLTDPDLRAEYDAEFDEETTASGAPPPPDTTRVDPIKAQPSSDAVEETGPSFTAERTNATDVLRRAVAAKFHRAFERQFERYQHTDVPGFDLACLPAKSGLFGATPPRILVRYVDAVDGAAVVDAWRMAVRMRTDVDRDICLFLLGPGVAPARELAVAIAEQRGKRMPGGATLSLVPVDARTWNAHIPTDAPPVVKTLLAHLRAA